MKNLTLPSGLVCYDIENTDYKGSKSFTRIPFWVKNGENWVLAGGLGVSPVGEDEGFRITTWNAKSGGGIQLSATNLRTAELRLARIIGGKKEAFIMELQGVGSLANSAVEFHYDPVSGFMWANILVAGKVTYRAVLFTDPLSFFNLIQEELTYTEDRGNDIPPSELAISTGGDPLPYNHGLNVAA